MTQNNLRKFSIARYLLPLYLAVAFCAPALLSAQEKTADDTNMEILREKLRADKKLMIAANMNLSDARSDQFLAGI